MLGKGTNVIGRTVNLRSVDDTNHTTLAVLALGAVEPDGLRSVFDRVHERRGSGLLRARNVSGPEALWGWRTWCVEGGLGDGVVLGPELEGDGIALGGLDVIGLEDQLRVVADDNEMVGREGGADDGESGGDGETHYDWMVEREASSSRSSEWKESIKGGKN